MSGSLLKKLPFLNSVFQNWQRPFTNVSILFQANHIFHIKSLHQSSCTRITDFLSNVPIACSWNTFPIFVANGFSVLTYNYPVAALSSPRTWVLTLFQIKLISFLATGCHFVIVRESYHLSLTLRLGLCADVIIFRICHSFLNPTESLWNLLRYAALTSAVYLLCNKFSKGAPAPNVLYIFHHMIQKRYHSQRKPIFEIGSTHTLQQLIQSRIFSNWFNISKDRICSTH